MKGLSKETGVYLVSVRNHRSQLFCVKREVQASVERTKVDEFANVLDVSASPTERTNGVYDTNYFNNFSDLGAWHGYYLPEKAIKSYWVVLRGH